MARKDNQEEYNEQEEKPAKSLFKKDAPEQQPETTQVRVISENELLQLRLNEISAKLDEILSLAKQ